MFIVFISKYTAVGTIAHFPLAEALSNFYFYEKNKLIKNVPNSLKLLFSILHEFELLTQRPVDYIYIYGKNKNKKINKNANTE
jgi:hypothetical protein